jgi:hypothetical protein
MCVWTVNNKQRLLLIDHLGYPIVNIPDRYKENKYNFYILVLYHVDLRFSLAFFSPLVDLLVHSHSFFDRLADEIHLSAFSALISFSMDISPLPLNQSTRPTRILPSPNTVRIAVAKRLLLICPSISSDVLISLMDNLVWLSNKFNGLSSMLDTSLERKAPMRQLLGVHLLYSRGQRCSSNIGNSLWDQQTCALLETRLIIDDRIRSILLLSRHHPNICACYLRQKRKNVWKQTQDIFSANHLIFFAIL